MISKLLICTATLMISADIPAGAAKNLLIIFTSVFIIVTTITKIANTCIYKYDDLYLK